MSADELQAAIDLHERVLDQLHWLDNWNALPPEDPDYVSLDGGIEDLLQFISEHDCPRLGRYHADDSVPTDWTSGVWHGGAKYWQDQTLLKKLKADGPSTWLYATTGLLAGVSDWKVIEFLTTVAKWPYEKACHLVGMQTNEMTGEIRYK
jgi:hypothetical protein